MKRSILGISSLLLLVSASIREPNVAYNNNLFAFDLYQKVVDENEGNIFFSPYSISSAFAMCYAGADGNTAEEMARVMHFSGNDETFHSAFGELNQKLLDNANGKIELNIANRLWGEQSYPFHSEYLNMIEDSYSAPFEQVDFTGNPEGQRSAINRWVERETKDKIVNLLPSGSISSDTRLVLANAIYFKGDWKYQFKKKKTKDKKFTLKDESTIKVPTMYYKGGLQYLHNDDYKMLRLPYKGDKHSMIVVLPHETGNMANVEKQMNGQDIQWMMNRGTVEVIVELPKFKMTLPLNLGPLMRDLGMEQAFTPGANFSKMSEANDLAISSAVHKAFIEIDEEGTEAAAATAIVMTTTSISMPTKPLVYEFIADHPFLFYIIDDETGSILFMGRVMQP